LILGKADKGNCLVILDKQTYINKVTTFLSNNHSFSIIDKDPCQSFTNDLKKIFSENHETIKSLNNGLPRVPMNPITPFLYGMVKIHKPNHPIRPVVSFINSPAYFLANWLNNTLKNILTLDFKYSIRNSLELVNRLKKLTLPHNCILVSFDVENLFPSIPRLESLDIIGKLLKNSTKLNNSQIECLTLLIRKCLNCDFCKFNNVLYKQLEGLPMGSSLSPLIAEIFMNNFENVLFSSDHHFVKKVAFWYRYVDDTLVGWTGSVDELNSFLDFLNSLHPNLKFTMEVEFNNKINFLDLTLERLDNTIEFKIYRKPTQTDHMIPWDSCHHISHKMAALNSLLHRLFSIPMTKENFEEEKNIIFQMALKNGFPNDIIHSTLKKKQRQVLCENSYIKFLRKEKLHCKRFVTLPYLGTISTIIGRSLQKLDNNIKVCYKSVDTISHMFACLKDKLNNLSKSGVYLLSCGTCPAEYVGQTGRSFQTRIKEHLRSSRLEHDNKSAFGTHLKTTKHSFSTDQNFKVLHPLNKSKKLDILENIEIAISQSRSPQNLNDHSNYNYRQYVNSINLFKN